MRTQSALPEAKPVAVRGSLELQPGGWPRSLAGMTLRFNAVGHGAPTVRRVPVTGGSWASTLAPGEWRVTGRVGGQLLSLAPKIFQVEPGGGALPQIQVLAAPAVRGRLVDCLGVPVAGVVVGLRDERRGEHAVDTTLSDGTFVLRARTREGRPWTVLVDEASLPDGVGTPWWQGIRDGGVIGSEHELPSVVGGEVVDVVLFSPGVANGRAVGARGEALRGVTLSIRMKPDIEQPARGANYVVHTDDAGAFETRLPSGRYEARLFPGSGGLTRAWSDPVIFAVDCFASEAPLTLRFEQGLGTRTLKGAVVAAGGYAIAGAHFQLHAVQPGLTFENRHYFHVKAMQYSDELGRFVIDGLPSGRYMLTRVGEIPTDLELMFVDVEDRMFIDLRLGDADVFWAVEAHVPGRVEVTASQAGIGGVRVGVTLDIVGRPVTRPRPISLRDSLVFERVLPGVGTISLLALGDDEPRTIATKAITVLAGRTTHVELP